MNHSAVEIVAHRIFLDNRVDKRQAASFASERPLAYARKVGVAVEAVFAELCHHTTVFHLAVFYYQVKKQLAHGRGFLYVAEAVHLHHLRYGEQGARVEPA